MKWSSLVILITLVGKISAWAGPPDIDDVMCAVCHFEQGEEFAESVHFLEGGLLCSDCHGGLPFEVDSDVAKAAATGFIGRPAQEDVAALCGQCHSGAASFFARGPHHNPTVGDNPTCISCHHNHRVHNPTLELLTNACTPCHSTDSPAARRGVAVRVRLGVAITEYATVTELLDSVRIVDRPIRKLHTLLDDAYTALRDAETRSHALDLALVDARISSAQQALNVIRDEVAQSKRREELRKWMVVGVWIAVFVNVVLLWLKRCQL